MSVIIGNQAPPAVIASHSSELGGFKVAAEFRTYAKNPKRSPAAGLWYVAGMELAYCDHSRLDERSLALHRLVARKVLANPALLDKARETARRWRTTDGSPSLALSEWESILGGPADQIAQFLIEPSERATRLRQSSPFCGILTEDERRAIYESYSTRTYHPSRQPNLG